MYRLAFEVASQKDHLDRLLAGQTAVEPRQADCANHEGSSFASDHRPVAPATQMTRFLTRI